MSLISKKGFTKLYAASGEVGSTLELSLDWDFAHAFVGIDFYSDAGLTTLVEPTAGTVTLTALPVVCSKYQELQNGKIAAVVRNVIDFAGNVTSIKAVPLGIVGATHYQLKVSTNRS